MNKYNNAPLPFQGQKRAFLKKFKEALNGFSSEATYVDLFGGSGLLSHTVKEAYPEAKVIWNDYDDYRSRLSAISQTNLLLAKLRTVVAPFEGKQRITDPTRKLILDIVKKHEELYGYVDYITLSSNLLFSMKYVGSYEQLTKETMYNRLKSTNYKATDYLNGVERVQDDYKAIYERYKGDNTVFLVDPPYLSTDTKTYNSQSYWRLRNYLDVLNVLDDSQYVYFTSNKSQIVELCEWVESRTYTGNPFEGSVMTTTSNRVNYSSGYTDIMLYKYVSKT